ncbi:Xylose isomerase domain-containing protein TIM barrel [Planctomycetales bacterium 10988]|nr:Xylose isomerase domain-containing protein TIM barrel [Planctomycetales bacterium 10988]
MERWPIGVFASVDAGLGVHLEVAHELKVPTIQLHAPKAESRNHQQSKDFLARCRDYKLTITAVFAGFEGESYADIPTTKKTVGLVPVETRSARTQEMKEIANYAESLGVEVVALHLGFIPHDVNSSLFRETVAVTQDVCDHCQAMGQTLHLETGQETAEGLLTFLQAVERDNLFLNFDPANMILYGTGNPIEALEMVGQYVRSVHCKDATWSDQPGETWGNEVPLGQGDVGMEDYLRTLQKIGYAGPLTIEREIPQEPDRQKAEIGQAVALLNQLKAKLA